MVSQEGGDHALYKVIGSVFCLGDTDHPSQILGLKCLNSVHVNKLIVSHTYLLGGKHYANVCRGTFNFGKGCSHAPNAVHYFELYSVL